MKFCMNEFPRHYGWKEYPRTKSANAKSFAYKWGMVVKLALVQSNYVEKSGYVFGNRDIKIW